MVCGKKVAWEASTLVYAGEKIMQDDLQPELDPFQAELESALLNSLEEVKPEKKTALFPNSYSFSP